MNLILFSQFGTICDHCRILQNQKVSDILSFEGCCNFRTVKVCYNRLFVILEWLALKRLQPHFLESADYSRFQSAYWPGYSTETALLEIVNDIRSAAGEGRCTVLLAFDISTVFDAVNHSILCQWLQHTCGMNGSALDLLRSSVSGRASMWLLVAIGWPLAPCEFGVPHGSVLGSLLFSLYFAPVSDIDAAHQCADDIQTSSFSVLIFSFSWSTALMTSLTGFSRWPTVEPI